MSDEESELVMTTNAEEEEEEEPGQTSQYSQDFSILKDFPISQDFSISPDFSISHRTPPPQPQRSPRSPQSPESGASAITPASAFGSPVANTFAVGSTPSASEAMQPFLTPNAFAYFANMSSNPVKKSARWKEEEARAKAYYTEKFSRNPRAVLQTSPFVFSQSSYQEDTVGESYRPGNTQSSSGSSSENSTEDNLEPRELKGLNKDLRSEGISGWFDKSGDFYSPGLEVTPEEVDDFATESAINEFMYILYDYFIELIMPDSGESFEKLLEKAKLSGKRMEKEENKRELKEAKNAVKKMEVIIQNAPMPREELVAGLAMAKNEVYELELAMAQENIVELTEKKIELANNTSGYRVQSDINQLEKKIAVLRSNIAELQSKIVVVPEKESSSSEAGTGSDTDSYASGSQSQPMVTDTDEDVLKDGNLVFIDFIATKETALAEKFINTLEQSDLYDTSLLKLIFHTGRLRVNCKDAVKKANNEDAKETSTRLYAINTLLRCNIFDNLIKMLKDPDANIYKILNEEASGIALLIINEIRQEQITERENASKFLKCTDDIPLAIDAFDHLCQQEERKSLSPRYKNPIVLDRCTSFPEFTDEYLNMQKSYATQIQLPLTLVELLGHYAVEIPHDATPIRLGDPILSNDLAYYVIQLMTNINTKLGGAHDCEMYRSMYMGNVEDNALTNGFAVMKASGILTEVSGLNVVDKIKNLELTVANNCSTFVSNIQVDKTTFKNIRTIGNLSILVDAGSSLKGARDFVIGLKNVSFRTSDGHFFHIFNTLECIDKPDKKEYYLITCTAIYYNGDENDGPCIVHSYTRCKIFDSDTGFDGFQTISVNLVKPIWKKVVDQMKESCPKDNNNACANPCNLSLKDSLYYLGCASSLKFHGDMGIAMETILGILVYGFAPSSGEGGGGGNIPAYVGLLKKIKTIEEENQLDPKCTEPTLQLISNSSQDFLQTVTDVYKDHCTASKDRDAFLLPFYFFNGNFEQETLPYGHDQANYPLIFRDVYTALNAWGELESKFQYSIYAKDPFNLALALPMVMKPLPGTSATSVVSRASAGGGGGAQKREREQVLSSAARTFLATNKMQKRGGAIKSEDPASQYYPLTKNLEVQQYVLDEQYEIDANIYARIKTMIEYKELVYGCLFLYRFSPILFSSGIDITDALFQDFQMDTVRKIYNMFILMDLSKDLSLTQKTIGELLGNSLSQPPTEPEYFTIDELNQIDPSLLMPYESPESMISDTLQMAMKDNYELIDSLKHVTCGDLFQSAINRLTHAITEEEWKQKTLRIADDREKGAQGGPEELIFKLKDMYKKTSPTSTAQVSPFTTPPESPPNTPPESPPRSPPRSFNPEEASELDTSFGGKRTRRKRAKRSKRKATRRRNGKNPRKQSRKHKNPRKRRVNTRRK